MKTHLFKRVPVLALAVALTLTVGTQALFGWGKEQAQPEEGAPVARDLEIATYRDIPYEAQFLASGGGGERGNLLHLRQVPADLFHCPVFFLIFYRTSFA